MMTKDELIAKQQLELEDYKSTLEANKGILKNIHGMFYSIGAPLNDNKLEFNKAQRNWCHEVVELIESLNP